MSSFIGREKELEKLKGLLEKKTASLAVIRGRRRIGKSRLIQEFSTSLKTFAFSGIPPTSKTTDESQRNEFAEQMAWNFKMPILKGQSWNDLFWHLADQIGKKGKERILLVLDEISWIGSKDPDFLGKLKNLWDLRLSQDPRIICILCGSASIWIEENILSSTGFLGRVSMALVLQELPLHDCALFWAGQKKRISSYEIFKVLSVTGGIPKYLEEIKPKLSAEENIKSLCFHAEGLLFREFDQIFSDLFFKKAALFKLIVQSLAEGSKDLEELCKCLGKEKSGTVSSYLHELLLAGFIRIDTTWNLKTKKNSKLRMYRLSDNYLRFYLKYISPNKEQIELGLFQAKSLSQLPGWNTVMGFQFENLVLNNYLRLIELLKIDFNDVLRLGTFFQNATKRQKGCQIDLLIQTRYGCLYVCEIKFYTAEISKEVAIEFENKLGRLSVPKGTSIRPVLIHCNGVSDAVAEMGLFDYIIDFSELLEVGVS